MINNQPIRIAQIMGKMVGGGVETFVMNYYRNIDREKIQFDFIIDSDSTCVPKEEIESLGGRIIEIPPYQKIFSYMNKLSKTLKNNNYKIVHSHINTLSVFPLYCAKKVGVPIRISHSHSTSNIKEWKKNIIKSLLKPFSKIFATHYFACSEYAGRWLFGDKTFNDGKVTVIHNAIDIDKFKYNEETRKKIRKELGIEDKFVIGHVGRFVKQKNHEFLINIFNQIHKEEEKATLVLIGDGPLEKKIKNKVNKMGLQEYVKFLGVRDNVNELMQAMDLLLLPSFYEGLGIVAIEAQCSGLPCICSKNVPQEVKISNLVEFCSLSSLKDWNNLILKSNKKERTYSIDITEEKKYDVKIESKRFLNEYLMLT